jgi:hypothetical protein
MHPEFLVQPRKVTSKSKLLQFPCTYTKYMLTFVSFDHFLVERLVSHGKNPVRGSFSSKRHSNISWKSTLMDL